MKFVNICQSPVLCQDPEMSKKQLCPVGSPPGRWKRRDQPPSHKPVSKNAVVSVPCGQASHACGQEKRSPLSGAALSLS